MNNKKITLRPIIIVFVLNILLSIFKISTGLIFSSLALLSDGINSSSDIIISIVLLVCVKLSKKAPDKDHPYGHAKYEGIANLILSLIFFLTSISIFYDGIINIIEFSNNSDIEPMNYLAIISSGITLVVKIFMATYLLKSSKRLGNNPTLKNESKNHFLDIFATLSGVIGIFLSVIDKRLRYFDFLAAILIAFFIMKLAIDVFRDSVAFLTDKSPNEETILKYKDFILSIKGVLSVDVLRVRTNMEDVYIDVEIGVDANLSLIKAHEIAENVHSQIENTFEEVLHIMVHVNPKLS
ncbi:MAG: cation diffusion facilitator family transporter [Acholeplasmatales bacterium]|jgi:cation diffusion facilitator family transporter|nr:cation diffusion facilitator family transporter [Acholeplasmatales bacterium]